MINNAHLLAKKAGAMPLLLLFACLFILSSCATPERPKSQPAIKPGDAAVKKEKPENIGGDDKESAAASSPLNRKSPEFMPVSEELSPLKTRIVNVAARGTPLKDVLHVIAEATGLNIVMEKGVNPDTPVVLTLKNVSAEDALKTIFVSVDYFYSVRENMLIIKAVETRIFEFGQPSVIQDYSASIGGDATGSGGGSTTTGTTGTGGVSAAGSTSLKGSVTQSLRGDQTAFTLWDSIDKTLGNLLGTGGSFSINRMTGTIIVTASKKDLERVENYLSRLKTILGRQVIIEARIVEVQLSEGLKYGIDWSALDVNKLGQITLSASKFTNVVTADLPSFQIGLSKWNFTGLLSALQSQGDVKVLSNPRVNVMNGQTSLLTVGRNVNFISKVDSTTTAATATSAATTTFNIQTSSVLSGIIIGIVPYINEEGDVTMTITPIISDLIKLDEKTVGASGQNSTQISLPTVDLRQMSTTVKVKDGQMVIIGGLIQSKENLQDNQVPVVGNIPLIGNLFKSRDKKIDRAELIIMLKPVVITQ